MNSISQLNALSDAILQLPHPRVLIPTMGALHQGHLTLVKHARDLAGPDGSVILTLFVNPTQFNQTEDLKNYPRTLESDLALCEQHDVDLVFTPNAEIMYHNDASVVITENSLAKRLCGASRPGHFNGVCTVVTKLFNLTQPDIAIFGKKDYQQLAIIRRMVRDLNIPIHIEAVETVREACGLAMSSRNVRLTAKQHEDARRIRRALLAAQNAHQTGENSSAVLIDLAKKNIEASPEGAIIDYLELLDAETLNPIEQVNVPAVMATAIFYDSVRLIDNIELTP